MAELEIFLYSLLGKRKRRILILTRWHTTKCIEGDSVQNVIYAFFNCLLYEPLALSLHNDYLKLFNVRGLHIPYEWLLRNELEYIKKLFVNRVEYFTSKEFYVNGTFTLKTLRGTLPIQYRRELVRDFIWMVMAQKDGIGDVIFLRVLQKMLLRDRPDRFVVEMHEALQGRVNVKDVLCVY